MLILRQKHLGDDRGLQNTLQLPWIGSAQFSNQKLDISNVYIWEQKSSKEMPEVPLNLPLIDFKGGKKLRKALLQM